MTDETTFERRIAALLGAIAAQMPADVDAMAMTRLAAARRPPSIASLRVGSLEWSVRLSMLGLVLALVGALVGGALLAGRFLDRAPLLLLTQVPPFIGLPPEGAAPSEPTSGELVLQFAARMPALGMEAQQGYLYADGRWIWQRNLEGSASAQQVFGDLEPTRAVIEQRLTPEGVALVEADVLDAMSQVPGQGGRPGTRPWGEIAVRIDGRLQAISWTDEDLPARLADPGSWLPEAAWADRELRGYVPFRYAICISSELELSQLPPVAAGMLRGRVGWIGPGNPSSIGTCYEVTTDVAREVAAALDAAVVERIDQSWQLAYRLAPGCCDGGVYFAEFLPDGELLLRGG